MRCTHNTWYRTTTVNSINSSTTPPTHPRPTACSWARDRRISGRRRGTSSVYSSNSIVPVCLVSMSPCLWVFCCFGHFEDRSGIPCFYFFTGLSRKPARSDKPQQWLIEIWKFKHQNLKSIVTVGMLEWTVRVTNARQLLIATTAVPLYNTSSKKTDSHT